MKKSLLFSITLLLAIFVKAQANKLSIGFEASPDFYAYQFKGIFGIRHENKMKVNYSLGVSLNYNLTEKFSLKSGLRYATKGYRLQYGWIVIDPNDPSIPFESDIKLNYIDIPLHVSYNFFNHRKIVFFATSGLVGSFLIKEKETSTMGDGSEKETKYNKTLFNHNFNKNLLAIELGIGVNHIINDKVFVSISPYLRYRLNKVSTQDLKTIPISFGINFGLHFNL